ncbi:MAG: family 43 glycosylhydrolase [Clostridia bacterium]|nr:family 43 glycosylhydrolase [Clostridia bacterium]
MKDALWYSDLGNGMYRNPVLLCDYSDPDVIRVGDTYYMTASTFNYVPGLPILVSKDLVNWELKNYALPNIPEARYAAPQHAQGVWAPAIRHHEGRFYIYYGMPDEGIFMVRTEDPLGEWEPPVCVLTGKGLIDPCPFWDDDGCAYVIHGYAKSRIGFKSILGIFPMSWDGTHAIGEDHFLFDGQKDHPTIEGPKVHKRGEWYYIFAPAGGVPTGWQVVMRSRSILGPYEDRVVLKQGSSPINGPHQGAWVDTPNGENWFFHFQSRGLYGRITHMQPMIWQEDGWPFIGRKEENPVDPAAVPCGEDAKEASVRANAVECGIPVLVHKKPEGPVCERTSEQGSDDFMKETPGLQWQFMGNWTPSFYTCGGGQLRLAALPPKSGDHLWGCPHVLTQKIACPAFAAQTELDASRLAVGERAGVAMIGGQYACLALERTQTGYRLLYVLSEGKAHTERTVWAQDMDSAKVTLRMTLTPVDSHSAGTVFAYSTDGERFTPVAEPYMPERHTWVGARLALYAVGHGEGSAAFGPFTVTPLEDKDE